MTRTFAVVLAVLAGAGCKKAADPVVARLEEITAQVERMPQANAAWQPGKVGHTFIIGSAVRTGPASHARLMVGAKGKLDVDASSVVYFTRTPGRERNDLHVEAGAVELESGDVAIGVGEAVLDPNTHVHVESTKDGTTLVVTVGRAVLEDNEIIAGEQVAIGPAGHGKKSKTGADAAAAQKPAAPDRPGSVAVAVRDAPARVKTADGEHELPVGEQTLDTGATVIVPDGSVVEVARGGARAVTSGPSQVKIAEGPTLLDVERGSVALHGESSAATVTMPAGSVTAAAGADATVDVDGKLASIDAQRGETTVETAKGKRELAAGQSASVSAAGEVTLLAPPPDKTVATLAAGESATVHDPKAPSPLRVTFDQVCTGSGVVEVARDRAFKHLVARSGGVASANVLVPSGSFNYRVRCPGGKGAAGTLRVSTDSGRTPLPKAAARTTVDMDGREYTILYQNLLPEISLTWKRAPRGQVKYTFVVQPPHGAAKKLSSMLPALKLAPGELREGTYRVWAEPGTGGKSEESRVVIDFDNAAQSVSIDTVETTPTGIRVRGTVIEGSTVSAAGTPVDLDRHRRFDTQLSPGPNEDGSSVRIAHPKAGIHYYVMRTSPP